MVGARLGAVTRQLEREAVGPLLTLDPERERATPLVEVHRQALDLLGAGHGELGEALDRPLAEGLCALALAQLRAFPGNLFWDLDLLAVMVVDEAGAAATPAAGAALVRDRFERMVELQRLYGRETTINFSYVHDFVYGFDWAKWVAREPTLHDDVPGPFSLPMLDYMHRRGHELIELIAGDDRKYSSLPAGQIRNPFPFARDPAAEIPLQRELARRGSIPVPMWDASALTLDWSTRWRRPWQAQRLELARELGLTFDH